MYTFSGKLKTFSIALMVIGALGIAFSLATAHKTNEEVVEMLSHETASHGEAKHDAHQATEANSHEAAATHHDADHLAHAKSQIEARPWAAIYVAAFFFFMITLGVLVFYAIQRASQAGWSIVLYRVMEGISRTMVPFSVIIFVLLVLSGMQMTHIFAWMSPENAQHDEILHLKSAYLNVPFFLIRAAIFLIGWNAYRYFSRKYSLAEDNEPMNGKSYNKNFKATIAFIFFFGTSEYLMGVDWLMSIDHHWFSTLYPWYVFSSMIVTAVTVIALVAIYLKSKGYLPEVNDNHIHDLAKYMFGFSIFWTYLWFAQYMLIWYSNQGEETVYFAMRLEHYKTIFFTMIPLNFVFPFLILMDSDFKRKFIFIVMGGISIIIGHYLDIYNLIMPGVVGAHYGFGIAEISAILFFLGLFVFCTFKAIGEAKLMADKNPFMEESKHFHY
jgi:hypothetical protein